MRIFPKLLLGLLPIVVLPLVLAVFLTVQRGNVLISELLLNNARLELEFLEIRCRQEVQTLESLGLSRMDFYRRNAQRNIIAYADDRQVTGAFLFILNDDGGVVFATAPLSDDVYLIESAYSPWDWTLGVAVPKDFLRRFTRESLSSALWLVLSILIPAVVVVFILARLFSRPISALEYSAQRLSAGDLTSRVEIARKDELGRLGEAFNSMASNVERLTLNLEDQVRTRTSELEQSLNDLQEAQDMLIKKERLANLGSVVAGLAHEINTPIGISVMSSTHLKDMVNETSRKFHDSDLSSAEFVDFMSDLSQISEMIFDNMKRANDLISNFKLLAVDQISEQKRKFNLAEYVNTVILSLHPRIKKTKISVKCTIDDSIEIVSYPGVFYQILSNLIVNSLIHGFSPDEKGRIRISASLDTARLVMRYEDDGRGIEEDVANRIYEPFVTTRSGEGGSGLGMNIVFNLVNRRLNGTIGLVTKPGNGVVFLIEIPDSELK